MLLLARIIEPTSKADSSRALAEAGCRPSFLPDLTRQLPNFAKNLFRQALSAACAACGSGAGVAGALDLEHAVFRDRDR
jgi:hypothetical protein